MKIAGRVGARHCQLFNDLSDPRGLDEVAVRIRDKDRSSRRRGAVVRSDERIPVAIALISGHCCIPF